VSDEDRLNDADESEDSPSSGHEPPLPTEPEHAGDDGRQRHEPEPSGTVEDASAARAGAGGSDEAGSAPAVEDRRVTVPDGIESTLPEDVPRIQLPLFEGPLDLLLYLIRREKIDIHDIPIAPITRQYMEYLDLMRELNLDVAGEFMVMAATLIHIKSKMLVPLEPTEAEGEEEYVDPRDELVQRLLEFQRYKEAAGILHQQAQIRAAQWTRPDTALPRFDEAGEEMLEAGLYDLIAAFKELLERRKSLLAHEIEADGPSVEERMSELLAMIREGESLQFLELFASLETKSQMITTFLALLELVRLKRVRVYQRGLFGTIRVFRPVGPSAGAAPPPST
jgi:segregation and condensation protein A